QMMGSAATSMSTVFNKLVNISPPTTELSDTDNQTIDSIDEEIFVKVSFQLKVGHLIDSNIMQLIPFPFAHEMVEELLEEPQEKSAPKQEAIPQEDVPMINKEQPTGEEYSEMDNKNSSQSQYIGAQVNQKNASVQQA